MAMNCTELFKDILATEEAVGVLGQRAFVAGGRAKTGQKKVAAPKVSMLFKEVNPLQWFVAYILKHGAVQGSHLTEYPDWLWHLLDRRAIH